MSTTKTRTIRDLYDECMYETADPVVVSTNHLLALLGVDPDMPVETLRRRLLWGERVEQTFRSEGDFHLTWSGAADAHTADVTEYFQWLTRDEVPT